MSNDGKGAYSNLNEENQNESKPRGKSSQLESLRSNICLGFFSVSFGLSVPIVTCYAISLFIFGKWALMSEDPCFAVEFPNDKQFDSNPIDSDPTNFIGLKVINVT